MITTAQRHTYEAQGYLVIPGLFSAAEIATLRDHYMALREAGSYAGDDAGINSTSNDPLRRYPRMIHMHRWDAATLAWMTDARLAAALTGLLEREPFAVQTILYFKPAGARGQALHQDNFYLRVQPGTCMAAWLALDDCDEANGCMQIVPGSHNWPVLCNTKADTTESFTDVTVPIPAGTSIAPVVMRAGDVLFFNGSLVHGSFPNTSTDRFRRALIGHYIEGDAEQVGRWYHPVLRMDGSEVVLAASPGGLPCGVWTDIGGDPEIEVSGYAQVDAGAHD